MDVATVHVLSTADTGQGSPLTGLGRRLFATLPPHHSRTVIFHAVICHLDSGSQQDAASASPGNLLEMEIPGPSPEVVRQTLQGWGSRLSFIQLMVHYLRIEAP